MLKIAWRNMLRNKRRSLLSIAIITIGVIVLFLVKGYISATYEGLEMMAISQNGHFQIASKGFWSNTGERSIISAADYIKIGEVLNGKEEVENYTYQLEVSGIIGTEKGSTIVSATGIEPGNDLSQGIQIEEGLNLFPGDENMVLLGKGIMQKLQLEVDEWVSIMGTTMDGAYNAGSLQVSGAFTTGISDADNYFALLPISFAQSLLNTDGVDNFIVLLDETENTDSLINILKDEFNKAGLDVEMRDWKDLSIMYGQVKGLYDSIFFFISIVVFILVFFSILEIMSMAFFERMNEIGTVRAIGTLRRQIFLQLFEESLLIGIVGCVIGLLGAYLTANLLNYINISYVPPGFSTAVTFYFNILPENGIIPIIVVLISTSISAMYPALKSARVNIVDMLRYT
ncbi:MAG: ABC transporter permease [Halanaerobiales bacterium]